MIDRLLKSSTGVPLIVNWCNGQLSPCENLASPPRTVHAQQSIRDIDRDLNSKAPQRFVLHAICSPARSGRRRISDPLSKLSGLRSRKLPARSFERSFKSALRTTLYPAIQSSRSHVGNFGSSLDGQAIAHVGDCHEPGATMWQTLLVRLRAQLLSSLRQVVDPGTPRAAFVVVPFVRPRCEEHGLHLKTRIAASRVGQRCICRRGRTARGNCECRLCSFRPRFEHPRQDHQALIAIGQLSQPGGTEITSDPRKRR